MGSQSCVWIAKNLEFFPKEFIQILCSRIRWLGMRLRGALRPEKIKVITAFQMMERDMQNPEKIGTHHLPSSSLALTFSFNLCRNILSHYLWFIALYWSVVLLCIADLVPHLVSATTKFGWGDSCWYKILTFFLNASGWQDCINNAVRRVSIMCLSA